MSAPAAHQSAAPATAGSSSRPTATGARKPGWMSIPGGPKEPNRNEFRSSLQAFSTSKSKLFDELNGIRAKFDNGDGSERDAVQSERNALRARLSDIDAKRRKERESRQGKNEEISKVRKQRAEIENQLRELSDELGAFREIEDIEMAIDHIMIKMETGGGSLSSEKKTVKRLNQLEQAKSLLLHLQPLQEAIGEYDDKESNLQQEYREIHEAIGKLNKEYEDHATVKQEKDKQAKKDGVDRGALVKERENIRAKITKINNDMTALREKFDKQQDAWNEWRDVARKKYDEKMQKEREDREKLFKERQLQRMERENATKLAAKRARAMKRLNPHETEINACTTLVLYLRDRMNMNKRDEEERKRRQAALTFDASTAAPSGTTMLKRDDEEFMIPSKKKQQQNKAPKKEPTKTTTDAKKDDNTKERSIQHNAEKQRMFALVGIDAPAVISAVAKTIEEVQKKQKTFESEIKAGDMILSSDDESDAEEAEEEPAAAAAEVVKADE